MYLTQAVHKGLREKPDALAAICGEERFSRAEFAERVARLAGALQGLGLEPEGRVAMLALNSVAYLEYFYGVWWAGGVVNPCNIRWNAKEVAYALDDCDTRILLVDDAFLPMVAELKQASRSLQVLIYCGKADVPAGMLSYESLLAGSEPVADAFRHDSDLAAIMYTGGTTGAPKGVMLSHANLYTSSLMGLNLAPRENVDTCLVVAPLFHIGGCGLVLQSMMRLTTMVVLPMFAELQVLGAIERHRANETFLVPTMIQRLIEHPDFHRYDLTSLQVLLYGAAPIDGSLLGRVIEALPNAQFCQAYGMTELAPFISALGVREHKPSAERERLLRSAGKPLSLVEVRIVDSEGADCELGGVGEIVVRSPSVMLGYWNKPKETAEVLRGGWMHTGDGGYLDQNGYLFVVDRLKDMIVSGGENVYSAEVENAITKLVEVQMCAVIGVPDDRLGERVHAVIVTKPGYELGSEAVIAHCKQHIGGYKCPRTVEFRESLPLSAAGKLQKAVLREPYWADRDRQVN